VIEEDEDEDEEEKVPEYVKRTREAKDDMEHVDGEFDDKAARIAPHSPRRE